MFGCEAHSTIFGVRMHAAQSSVGKVLSYWAMRPPMEGVRSTSVTLYPADGDIERGLDAGNPAADDQRRLVSGISVWNSGSLRRTLATAMRVRSMAFSVACALSLVHPGAVLADVRHLHHERVQARLSDAAWNVGSCSRGEQEATTIRSRLCSLIAWRTMSCPGSEHIYL